VDFSSYPEKFLVVCNCSSGMYRRNLPHWHPPGATLFVTWCLAGMEDGSRWLGRPQVAECVVNHLLEGEDISYRLHAFVVMPNHVHLLLTPWAELASITRSIKGRSAREANLLIGRTGRPFWQDESFDHWIRHRHSFERARLYIERNPVRAGFVKDAGQWPYSSASDHRLKPVLRRKK
jgi:REP element-mobilizing transposase RayT